MADEQVQNTNEEQVKVADTFNPFAAESTTENQPTLVEEIKTPIVEDKVEVKPPETSEEVVEYESYFEKEFGKKPDVFKAEHEELRKFKEERKEQAYINDESKRLHEAILAGKEDDVFEILARKKQIQQAEKLNINEPKEAAQLIKLSLQLNHPELEGFDISDLYDEQYTKPEKPKQGLEQTDEDYQTLVDSWKVRCDAIDRKIVRDAKMALPNLQKLKSEIVLPDIPKQQEESKPKELTQEELDAAKKFNDSYLQSVNASVSSLKGFTAKVKDKDVDFTVSYTPSQEEKTAIEVQLKSFAEKNGYNANAMLAQRWANPDGTIQTDQMAEDLDFLNNKEKILQKVANDAASQRLELFLKSKKNINVGETSVTHNFSPDGNGTSELDKARQIAFSN